MQPTPSAATSSDSLFLPYAGAFRAGDGITWGLNGHGNLANFSSGWYRQLFPTSRPGHFTVGPGFQVAVPKVADVVFSPASGTSEVMTIRPVSGATTVAHRIHFTTSEVRVPSSGAVLAATITGPASPGPHPGIVIVHGSGVGLRVDYGIWVALYASLGFTVLAYDKRGNGGSTGNYPGDYASDAALSVLAGDAATCWRFLARWRGVDSSAVGFHGGSQGGWIVPLAIESDPMAAFAVLLSAPAVSVGRQATWADFSGGSQYLPTESAAQMDAAVRAQNTGYDPAPVLSRIVTPIPLISSWLARYTALPSSVRASHR